MLWFPTFFTKFMPGWLLNVATGFIFTVHFFNSHLRPEKFPMDPVIFTGRMTEEELKHDKPGLYEELVKTNQLTYIEARRPDLWLVNFAKIFGYTAVAIGLILAVLIFLIH